MSNNKHLTCQQPDRHFAKAICGYPLPCPHHTATIDLTGPAATITFPVTFTGGMIGMSRLLEIATALEETREDLEFIAEIEKAIG